jgi:hypothetical protein
MQGLGKKTRNGLIVKMTANGGKEESRTKRATRYQRFIGGVIIATRKALKALDEGISKRERTEC